MEQRKVELTGEQDSKNGKTEKEDAERAEEG